MPRVLSIDAIGAVIDIDGSALSHDAWAAAKVAWQDAVVEPPGGAAPSATVIAHGTVTPEAMLAGLSVDVTVAALEARAGDLLMLHSAGLATEQGGVVALVGPSGRGKTTASRVLGRVFSYVSDESVGIAADGNVLPYRKPLSLIELNPYLKVQRSPTELGLLALPTAPLRLAALVLLERSDAAIAPRVELVSLAVGIVELAQQASYLGRLPSPLRTLTAHIEAVGGVRRITYSNAESLAPIIQELGANAPATPGVRAAKETPAAPPQQTLARMLRRAIAGFLSWTHSLSTISRSCCWYRMTSSRRESSCWTVSPRRSGGMLRSRSHSPRSWRRRSQSTENLWEKTRLRSWPNPLPISARPACWSWTSPFRVPGQGAAPRAGFRRRRR